MFQKICMSKWKNLDPWGDVRRQIRQWNVFRFQLVHNSEADPGFPVGGAVDLVGGGVDSWGSYVSKMLYVKTKELGPLGGGRAGRVPLDPPMQFKNPKFLIGDYSKNKHISFLRHFIQKYKKHTKSMLFPNLR